MTSSSTFAVNIPTVTAIRDAIQYGDVRLARCNAFNDTLLVFRKNYVTSTGLRGTDVYNWKSDQHQAALTEMSQAFLDRDGNGELFWPTDPTSPNFNNLQYRSDQQFIRTSIKHLIYRSNVQQYRNAKYKRKAQLHNNDSDNNSHQQQGNPSIEGLSDGGTSTSPTTIPSASTMPKAQPTTTSEHETIADTSRLARPTPNTLPIPPVLDEADDIFVISDSPEMVSEDNNQAPKRKPRKSANGRLPKRPKPYVRKTGKRAGASTNDISSTTTAKWTSPRGIKTIRHPDRAHTDEINSAIASPVFPSTPGTSQSTTEDLINYIRNNRPSVTDESSVTIEPSNAPQNLMKGPPIDPALPSFPRFGSTFSTFLHQGRDENNSISSRDTETTTQTRSNNAPRSKTTARVAPAHQSPQEKAPAGESTSSVDLPKSGTAAVKVPKPNVEFTYRVIIARKPIYQYEKWKIQGNFQSKSLVELANELPVGKGYEALVLRLQGPGITVEETVKCNREDEFTDVKRQFNKVVRSLALNQARTKPEETLVIRFEIEPLRNEDDMEDDDDAELEDFTW